MNSDFIAFLDDDEIASSDWIEQLLAAQSQFEADIVAGPVPPLLSGAPQWVVEGGFLDAPSHSTGAYAGFVASGNVLLRAEPIRHLRFDPRFDRTGGGDTHFFERAKLAGMRVVWAEDARAYEFVPPERTTAAWILNRAYSSANRYTRSCLYLNPGYGTLARRAVTAIGGLLAACALLPLGVFGKWRLVKAFQFAYRAWGTLQALRGNSLEYYV
jgi:hypothetical protein